MPTSMPPTTAPAPELPWRSRARVSGQLWLLNVLFGALLCGEYIPEVEPTLRGWSFLQLARISCAATLSLGPGLLLLAAAASLRSRRVLGALSALFWTLLLLALFVDTRIYGIFRYHFNGMVWNVLTTPGADEAVHLAWDDVVFPLADSVAALVVEYGAFLLLVSWEERRVRREPRSLDLPRPTVVWSTVILPCVLAAAGVYAYADLVRDPQVMAFARVYPFFPRVTVKRFAREHLGVELAERREVDVPSSGILVDYPKRPVSLPADGARPNIVVVVIDSLRADMLSPEVMPRTSELGARGRVFADHLSGGNATRFGLFSLIYGLHGSYWKPIYHEHRSPVLVDALLERGYALRVLTSASMDYPEFRSTAWVRVESCVEDRLPSERPGGRDDGVAQRFDEWLSERDPLTPFFAFLLLDAPHQKYTFPAESAVFQPYADDVAYGELAGGASPGKTEALFNRYRNAVHYADQTTGRILDSLASRGLLDGTLLVVTGDHGEEFFEHGFYGHTSNFTGAQARVALVLAGPGIPPGVEERPTSHVDLPATLLELLGADPALRPDWTLGASLLAPASERARVVAGWDTLGLHTPSGIIVVPLAAHERTEIYDERWQRIFDDDAILEREGRALGRLAQDCRRFLR